MGQTTLDTYAVMAMDFCEAIADARDSGAVKSKIVNTLAEFGYDYVTCATLPAPGTDPLAGVLMNTRPHDRIRHYIERNYLAIDPVIAHLRTTLRPYSWGDVRANPQLSKRDIAILDGAQDFNMHDGMIIPIVSVGGEISIFGPCGKHPDLSPRARTAMTTIGVAAHHALSRLAAETRLAQQAAAAAITLTPREREVLTWIVRGKTDYEIAKILGIAQVTVLQHVENAKRKYNTGKRLTLVVEALRRSEITL